MLATIIALAAATVTTPATPATATPVAAKPTPVANDELGAWVAKVEQQIAAHLVQPQFDSSGIASVAFRRGVDGRPVEISARSGSPAVSRAAIQTLRRAGALPPMPASMPGNQRVTFRFLVGANGHEAEYETQRGMLLASARRTNVALAAQLASKVQVAALPTLPGHRVELAALERR